MEGRNKPPLGLVPEFVNNRDRSIEIMGAIGRYLNSDKEMPIPREWLDELSRKLPISEPKRVLEEESTTPLCRICSKKLIQSDEDDEVFSGAIICEDEKCEQRSRMLETIKRYVNKESNND
jgi:hypothetical protein|tara:strand:+ start:359 stop:721 length:363 start_codon:yes stop_codon:yes gene_type:complete